MSLSTIGVSRCGEVFVTDNADKWTFFCSFCQKSINDIGVFICHIRLDHLDRLQHFQSEEIDTTKPEAETNYIETSDPELAAPTQVNTFSPNGTEEVKLSSLIKDEETLSQFSFDSQTFNSKVPKNDCPDDKNIVSNKNAFIAYISSDESNDKFLSTGKDSQDEEFISIEGNNEPIGVAFKNNDEIIDIDDDIDDDKEDIEEIFDSDESNENTGDAIKATEESYTQNLLIYSCRYCARRFSSTRGLHCHQIQAHREKYVKKFKHKCQICLKAFKTRPNLKQHSIMHDSKTNLLQCSVCFVKLFRMSSFLQHVMKHESDKCFPCQTCGKVCNSNDERVTHWETHAKEKPYACSTCFRRFSKDYFLERHLSTHGKYSCHYCSKYFTADYHLRYPYICPDCGKLPDIKQVAERLQIAANKKHPNNSNVE